MSFLDWLLARNRSVPDARDPTGTQEHLATIDGRLDRVERRQDALLRILRFDVEAIQHRADAPET